MTHHSATAAARPIADWARGTRHVFVSGLELPAHVGVYEHEKSGAQRIRVCLDLTVRDDYDGRSDRLKAVYDYDVAIAATRRIIAEGHFQLIETLAERIAEQVLTDKRVLGARIRIEKLDAVPGCGSVGIEIERLPPHSER